MTHGEKVRFLVMALAMEGITITQKTADTIVTTYSEILEKKGKFKLKDALKIKAEIDERYQDQSVAETPNISEKQKKKLKFKKTKNTKSSAETKTDIIDGTLKENMLGVWINRGSTIAKLQQLKDKYPAGLPMRLRTLIRKHASPELLHKDLKDVIEDDLVKLPRMGKKAWEAFCEARDFKLP